ncbi:MAG: glycosyltransferase family 87 protein [Nannocystaceae bacterium]
MLVAVRRQPECWLFTGFVALLLAPVITQGLDRPLASLAGSSPSGVALTVGGLVVALLGWLLTAACVERRRQLPWAATVVVAIAVGLAVDAHPPGVAALVAAAMSAVGLARWLPPRTPPAVDGLIRRHRALTGGYVLFALLSIVQVSRVSVFMADPARTDAQIIPGIEFLEHHSCLTAYVRADELAHDGALNLYRAELWPNAHEKAARPVTPFSPFDIDAYFYPPTFLLVAELLAPLRGDYLAQRAAWFGLNGLLLAAALWIVARRLGGPRWHRPLLIAPLFFASLPVLLILQVGNAQAAVVIISVLAMLSFELERPALGGFLLALATLSKVSPGILGVVLLAQRRDRAVAWTAGFGLLLLAVTATAYGLDPLVSWFRYTLPRLSSGEAFLEMLNHRESVPGNAAPFAWPFKLALLGVDVGDPWPIARRISQAFTLLVVTLAVLSGRKHAAPAPGALTPRALEWMALLFLTALRSPFAPAYVLFAFVWAITLWSAEVTGRRGGVALVLLFIAVTTAPPLPYTAQLIVFSSAQLLATSVAVWLLLRPRRRDASA